MKNLNKKIGVVVLSGLVLAGVGVVSSSSVSHANSSISYGYKKLCGELINDVGKVRGFQVVSYDFNEGLRDEIESKYNGYGCIKYLDPIVFDDIYDLIKYLFEHGGNLDKGLYEAEVKGFYMVIKKP